MHKVLLLLVLGVLTTSVLGQPKQPSKTQTNGKTTQKKTATVSKTQTVGVKKPRPAAVKAAPRPAPSTPDPEADKKRFEEALAAPSNAEKAKRLRIFLDEFPASDYAGEATEYLVMARAMTGSERLETGDVDEAVASFRLVVDEAPTPIPDRLFNDVVLKAVLNLYHRGQQKPALELAARVEKKVAGSAKHLLGLAALYLGAENGAEARRLAEAAIAVDPTLASGYQALGLAHRLSFDLESSATAYAKAAELDPNSLAARRSLAEMKRALGKPEDAAAIYRSILVSNEGDTSSRTGLILSLFDAGKRSEAETELSAAMQRDPRNFTLLAGVAYWYAANNQAARAVEYAQKAIDAEPRYIWGHIALARGLMKENKPLEAERALIKARQYGNFPTLDYEIASARFMAGLYREAIEELGRSFTIKDGVVRTRLGGRVATEGKSFQEAIGNERRASILAPAAADDIESSEKMRLLFEISGKVEAAADEAELSALADEFVRGDDKMKLHRQLHVANLYLQKNVAPAKVGELLKASLGNAETGLEVPAPSAAVMASELYEGRAVAFSRNEVLLIPELPRQMLSAILRGRIEELSGWALYQQKNYPEAVIRLKRAVNVLPDKSAWWRSSVWRLAVALEADGKDKEALDSYIQSYKTDRPNALRYRVIESLYVKVHGSRDGLDDLIGADPQSAVSALPQKSEARPEPSVPAAERSRDVKEIVPASVPSSGGESPPGTGSKTSPIVPKADVSSNEKFDAKALIADTSKTPAAGEPKLASELVRSADQPKNEITDAEKNGGAKIETAATEKQPEKAPIIVRSAEAHQPEPTEKGIEKKDTVVVSLSELLNKRRSAESVETEHHPGAVPSAELGLKQPLPQPEPPSVTEAASAPGSTADNAAADRSIDQKAVPEEKAARTSEKEENKAPLEPKKEVVKDESTGVPADQPKPEPPKPDPPKTDNEPGSQRSDAKPEAAIPPRDPLADPTSKSSGKAPTKPEVIVDDPLKPPVKSPRQNSESKALFEPIIITVPQTWKQNGKPSDLIKAETESSAVEEKKASTSPAASGSTRTRLVTGKEVLSDQRCSIDVSDETVVLLNGGGSFGVLVTIVGDGTWKELTASSNSPRDIEVRAEPEIDGLPGRRFYVVKSVSIRTGMFQVNFESPCGKKEIAVRVK